MTKPRPSVFVGSSAEGLKIAKIVQVTLDHTCQVTIWSQGVFGLGEGTLEALVRALGDFDFAILVMTPDDLVESRGTEKPAPRDNVLLELGLFIGALGRQRTFALYDRTANIKLPSDLAGVTIANYQPHDTGNLRSALGAPCTLIEEAIERLGLRPERELSSLKDATKGVSAARDQINTLVRLLARSRKVELDIISTQFGPLINSTNLA
jgi:predicted nucleotide-binding protein